MNMISFVAPAAVLFLVISTHSSAEPWKDNPGKGRGDYERSQHSNKYKTRHPHQHKGGKKREVIYVYKDAPAEEVDSDSRGPERTAVDNPKNSQPPRTVKTGIEGGNCNRDDIGTVLGGVVGGVVGYQIGKDNGNKEAGTVLGAIAGAVIGKKIGKNMDRADRQCTAQTLEHAKDGQTVSWRNPDNGVDYKMTPIETYRKDELKCRRYVAVATSDSERQALNREACRQPDGQWSVSASKSRL
jgi:surface antigen